jgi:hypothetical protein
MQAYRVEKVIPQTGKIELDALPFAAGAVVEVIILGPEKAANGRSHSLKGTVIKYDDPFEPVAENEWEVLQ